MTTRRDMLKSGAGLAAILATGKAPAYLVKSMLAARNSIGIRAGGEKLPYDAEVEYLESTGTQYINLGKLMFAEFKVSLAPVGLATPHYTYAYLGWNNNGSRTTGICSKNVVGTLDIRNYSGISIDATVSDWTSFHDISYNGGVATVDGTDYNITLPTSPEFDFCLFGLKRLSAVGCTKCRIAAFSAKNSNGDFIMDLIPVRFTNELGQSEGTMYDRVSGELEPFRNRGTGAFLWGTGASAQNGGGYNLICVWRAYTRSWGPSSRFWRAAA